MDENFEHTELTSAHYMRQILEGMQYVHKQNIVHLDLKPENIVCVDTTGTQIKIIDFGLASKLSEIFKFVIPHPVLLFYVFLKFPVYITNKSYNLENL